MDWLVFSPRFAVEQGLKADGSIKLRPIDDFTASQCNEFTAPAEKLRCDTLDCFLKVMRKLSDGLGREVTFFLRLRLHRVVVYVFLLLAGATWTLQG